MRNGTFRVLLAAPLPPPWGGISKQMSLFTTWLKGRNEVAFDVVDITPRLRSGTDIRISRRLATGTLQLAWDVSRVLARLLTRRYRALHVTTSGGLACFRDLTVLRLGKLFGVPAAYHIHMGRLPSIRAAGGWEWRIFRRAMRAASWVVVLDEASADAGRGIPGLEVVRVPNAVEMEALEIPLAAPRKAVNRVLYLGWMLPAKGLNELVEAWGQTAFEGWELLLIGPGPARYIRELADRAGSDPRLRILGAMPNRDARNWLKTADILILPSYTEGFPNVILEAMAEAKAIVATPVGAVPEMLDFDGPKPCGVRIPARDSAALAEALRRLMNDVSLRTELGRRARRKAVSDYDMSVVFPQILSLWRGGRPSPTTDEGRR